MFGIFKRAKERKAMAKALRLLEAEKELVFRDLGNQLEAKLHTMPLEEALEWCRKIRES